MINITDNLNIELIISGTIEEIKHEFNKFVKNNIGGNIIDILQTENSDPENETLTITIIYEKKI